MADENFEDDIFDDLYDDEPSKAEEPAPAPAPVAAPEPIKTEPAHVPQQDTAQHGGQDSNVQSWQGQAESHESHGDQSGYNAGAGNQSYNDNAPAEDDNYGPINVKEDGKMFIGGLNWETTEQSLKDYFSQFGEVSECTVMRDSATQRSRGFGFLTFKDAKCVNTVMVKEHYLDGKIIDPKRAIPREEQERTSKIFVGGVSQEATDHDFRSFFQQFGRVIDATLMMDKDTGRPRGFGFVTFDGDAAVDATLKGPLQILGKPIEVKRAQPRGNMRDEDGGDNKKFGRNNKFNNRNDGSGHNNNNNNNNSNNGFDNSANQAAGGMNNGMTPSMMAQYWQRMQQYFATMQQSLAQQQGGMGAMNGMGGGMNPMAMQAMMAGQGMNRGGNGSPNPMMNMGGMNPMQMQQMQAQMAQQQQNQGAPRAAYNPGDQLAFEQQKYEQQQRRQQQLGGYAGANGPTSWDGMYEDMPQPNIPQGPGAQRGGFNNRGGSRSRQGSSQPPSGPSNAPINAPTGPKNAGVRGANYRGGGRGQNYRHQPYGAGRGA